MKFNGICKTNDIEDHESKSIKNYIQYNDWLNGKTHLMRN